MSDRLLRAIWYPLLSVLIIALYAGGLGVIFMTVYGDVHHPGIGEWLVVAIGMALLVGVPTGAYLIQRKIEQQG